MVQMQCVKTGAIIQVNCNQRWVKGDLYRLGDAYIMKANFWCMHEPVDWMTRCHAEFNNYLNWWGDEGMGDRFDIIFFAAPLWFDYEGVELPKQ